MKLHSYRLGYVPYRLIEHLKERGEPFDITTIIVQAQARNLLFSKVVRAFTAEDVLVQLRATEGGSFNQPPFVVTIEPLDDEEPLL
jgi:hypothetical protein